ncbi:hypothetical protein SAMN05216420_106134 [Nitrosospira sp. Nl5]|nr:hypothetical protein SAMN05216420_106134 [Nitrosospira sp. Nl5]
MTFTIGNTKIAFSYTPPEDTSWIKRGKTDRWSKPGPKHSDAEANRLLRNNSQVFTYVPGDIKSAGEPSVRCDQGGIRTESSSGYCLDYHSPSKRTSWKIRYERGGRVDRIFKYAGYKNKYSSLDSWVVFNSDPATPYGSVLLASPAAEQALRSGGNDKSFTGFTPDQVDAPVAQ